MEASNLVTIDPAILRVESPALLSKSVVGSIDFDLGMTLRKARSQLTKMLSDKSCLFPHAKTVVTCRPPLLAVPIEFQYQHLLTIKFVISR